MELEEILVQLERVVKKEDLHLDFRLNWIETEILLNYINKLRQENEELISDNLEYQRIQDIFDKRTYRKKYLEERRKEDLSLLYPDSDEIYKRYYELKKENEGLKANNYEIKTTYRKMAKHFEKIGKQETAEYMLAQIEDVPVWVVDDEKDYIPKSVIQDKIEEYRNKRNKLADGTFWDNPRNINEDMSLFIAGETLKELLGEN